MNHVPVLPSLWFGRVADGMAPPRKRHSPQEADDRGGGLLDFFASLNPFSPQNPFRNTGATLFDLFSQFVGGQQPNRAAPGNKMAPGPQQGQNLPPQFRKESQQMGDVMERHFSPEDRRRMGYGGG